MQDIANVRPFVARSRPIGVVLASPYRYSTRSVTPAQVASALVLGMAPDEEGVLPRIRTSHLRRSAEVGGKDRVDPGRHCEIDEFERPCAQHRRHLTS